MTSATISFDMRNRSGIFNTAEKDIFDLLVIGGGITGAGIARDATLRGLSVVLVEARDFASGTSSRSTKLIHGGLRYIAQGELSLVREASRERAILRRIAPHLVHPLPMLLPATSLFELTKFKAGVWLYDKLGKVTKRERHKLWNGRRLKREEPLLSADIFAGAILYHEYLTDDARLTLANIRDAAARGARILSYARVDRLLFERGAAAGALVTSTLPGEDKTARVKARVVVNAAGPWVDRVRRLESDTTPSKLQLTKGIHLVLPRERLPLTHAVMLTAEDKRLVFAVPRGGTTYIGTTDSFYSEADYCPDIAESDIDYLLRTANTPFDIPPLTKSDITALWAGLRPLLAQPGKSPSEISRRDEILEGPSGMLSIAGGKLTSFRKMAERIVDRCEARLDRSHVPAKTADYPLPGGDADERSVFGQLERLGLAADEARRATSLYGTEAPDIFAKGPGVGAEVDFAVKSEGALTLEDYWMRRSARAWFDSDAGLAALVPAADRMAELMNWSAEEKQRQIDGCLDRHRRDRSALSAANRASDALTGPVP